MVPSLQGSSTHTHTHTDRRIDDQRGWLSPKKTYSDRRTHGPQSDGLALRLARVMTIERKDENEISPTDIVGVACNDHHVSKRRRRSCRCSLGNWTSRALHAPSVGRHDVVIVCQCVCVSTISDLASAKSAMQALTRVVYLACTFFSI